ncbi:cytochrome P450 4d8-like [Onthophagus taurus]|uniref:cytochrome P450 4d8-like n=1 Tax=Onthophagus taurus TaxID=166361 RepID=UPI0039BDA7CA
MFLLPFLIVIIPILVIVWLYSIYFRYKKHLNQFNYVKISAKSTKEIYDLLMIQAKNGFKNAWTMLGPYPALITADPKMFNKILGSIKHITKPITYKAFENSVKGTLFYENGLIWKNQRRYMTTAFDQNAVLRFVNIFNKRADELVDNLKLEIEHNNVNNINVVDIKEHVDNTVLKFVYESFLDDEIDDLKGLMKKINLLSRLYAEKTMNIFELFKVTYFFTRNYWIERNIINYLHSNIKKVINKRLKNKINMEKIIFIDMLLNEMKTNQTLDEDLVIRQIKLMLEAGFDTTTYTISFLLYNLSKNPKIQEKVFNEIVSILGDNRNEFISFEKLKEMKYIDLVIKESLRIYTTGQMFSRYLLEDVKISDEITLPQGLTVTFLPGVMHRNPDLYPNPEEFIPERFKDKKFKENRFIYAPFCLGVRQCIGKQYAQLAIKTVLIKILLNYELVDVQHELCLAVELTLVSENGVKIGLKKREST